MAEEKKFLDYEGLVCYDEHIKALIKSGDLAVESAILQQVFNDFAAKSDLTWGALGEE